jgi:hypothetical protein
MHQNMNYGTTCAFCPDSFPYAIVRADMGSFGSGKSENWGALVGRAAERKQEAPWSNRMNGCILKNIAGLLIGISLSAGALWGCSPVAPPVDEASQLVGELADVEETGIARQIGFGLLGFAAFVIGWGVMRRRRQGGGPVHSAQPNQRVSVETGPGLQLSDEHARLLKALFGGYTHLKIHREFLPGSSGVRTYLIQPVRPGGGRDAGTIVKIGPQRLIGREYANYETFVKDTLPPDTARIQDAPLSVKGSALAAMRYAFGESAGQELTTLREVLLANPDGDHLRRLYETYGPMWWQQNHLYDFTIREEYDHLLPPHLILKPSIGKGIRWRITEYLDERMRPDEIPALGAKTRIPLRKFSQAELRADGKSMSLRGLAQPGHAPLRITWLSPEKPAVGTLAEVVADRRAVLEEVTQGFDRCGLPDPLAYLPEALQAHLNGKKSIIHGSLHLENILVGSNGLLGLIDFTHARQGHALADFAFLEAELIAHVAARLVEGPQDFVRRMDKNDLPLYVTLREIAAECMLNSAGTKEYDLAVYLSCLGGLKFESIDHKARHLLYLRAAFLSKKLRPNG